MSDPNDNPNSGITPVQYIIELAIQLKQDATNLGSPIMVAGKHQALNHLIAAAVQFLDKEESMLKAIYIKGCQAKFELSGETNSQKWFDAEFPNNHNSYLGSMANHYPMRYLTNDDLKGTRFEIHDEEPENKPGYSINELGHIGHGKTQDITAFTQKIGYVHSNGFISKFGRPPSDFQKFQSPPVFHQDGSVKIRSIFYPDLSVRFRRFPNYFPDKTKGPIDLPESENDEQEK